MVSLATLRFVVMTAFLLVAVVSDLRHRKIPNRITMTGALAGLLLGALEQGGLPTAGLIGAFVALAVSFPLFALGGLGAGDAKLLAMVGTFVGPGGLLSVLIYGGIAGGILAVGSAARRGVILPLFVSAKELMIYLVTFGRQGQRKTLETPGAEAVPYGLAIAVGALVATLYPLSLGALQ